MSRNNNQMNFWIIGFFLIVLTIIYRLKWKRNELKELTFYNNADFFIFILIFVYLGWYLIPDTVKCFQRFVILIVLSLAAVCGVLFGHWADLSGRYIFPIDWTTAQWIKLDLFQCTSSEHYVLKIVLLMFFLFHPV